jgi:hypothetical protein
VPLLLQADEVLLKSGVHGNDTAAAVETETSSPSGGEQAVPGQGQDGRPHRAPNFFGPQEQPFLHVYPKFLRLKKPTAIPYTH